VSVDVVVVDVVEREREVDAKVEERIAREGRSGLT
jgi:hypothetical protein